MIDPITVGYPLSPHVGVYVTPRDVCGACTTGNKTLFNMFMLDDMYRTPHQWENDGWGDSPYQGEPRVEIRPEHAVGCVFSHVLSTVAGESAPIRSGRGVVREYIDSAVSCIRRGMDDMILPAGITPMVETWGDDGVDRCVSGLMDACDVFESGDFPNVGKIAIVSTRFSITIPLYRGFVRVPVSFVSKTKRGFAGVAPFFSTGDDSECVPGVLGNFFTKPGEMTLTSLILWDLSSGRTRHVGGDVPDMFTPQ